LPLSASLGNLAWQPWDANPRGFGEVIKPDNTEIHIEYTMDIVHGCKMDIYIYDITIYIYLIIYIYTYESYT
jgi:hypothetical protein